MPKKRHKPEEIVAKLRQVDVLTSQGSTVADAIRPAAYSNSSTSIAVAGRIFRPPRRNSICMVLGKV